MNNDNLFYIDYGNKNNYAEINNICDFLKYCYLYTDVINFDKNDKNKNTFEKYFTNDDIIIYALIIKTNSNNIRTFFLNNILILKDTPTIILEKNVITKIINKICEILILLKYWYNNLSNENILKNQITDNTQKIIENIQTIIYVLNTETTSDQTQYFINTLKKIINTEPFNKYTNNDAIHLNPTKLNTYEHIFNTIRETFEQLIIKIIKLQKLAIDDFFTELYNKNHNPHISLLLSFHNLLKKVNTRLNDFSSKFQDYYYKGVLMFKNNKERKDKVLIMLSLNEPTGNKIVDKNTEILGQKDSHNNDIVFKTISTINVTSTKIKTIRTISKSNATNSKFNSNISTIYSIAEYLMDDVYNNNKLLFIFSPKKGNDINFLSTKRNTLGYFFTSKLFYLSEGYRTITMKFYIDNEDTNSIIQSLKDFNLYKTNDRISLQNYVESLSNSLKITYTSSTEYIDIPQNNISLKWDNTNNSILILIKLTPEMPEMTSQSNSENITHNPGFKILAATEEFFWAFNIFTNLKFTNINIYISVEKCNNLILQNDIGVIDTNSSFEPFGVFPKPNAPLYIANEEIFKKKITSLKFRIKWNNLPEEGFKKLYENYNSNINDSSFKINISSLYRKEWIPNNESEKQVADLFNTDLDGNLKNETVINISINKLKLNEYTDTNYETEYLTPSTVNGYIKFELSSPTIAFGHTKYQELLTQYLTDNKSKVTKNYTKPKLNEPYTPSIKNITIDYTSELNIENNSNTEFEVHKIHPFGYFKVNLIKEEESSEIINTTTDFTNTNTSTILIELTDVDDPIINLYFVIDETTTKPSEDKLNFKFGYIYDNKYTFFKSNNILEDQTLGFKKSGKIKLKLPKINKKPNTYIGNNNKNSIWVGICFFEDKLNLPTIIGIYYNCVEAIRTSENDELYLQSSSLNTINNNDLNNITIYQPFNSYGGKKAETDTEMYQRIRNRLQLKNRCISNQDYITFILENFNEVKYAKIIRQEDLYNTTKNSNKNTNGQVNIIIILNKNEYTTTTDILQPASPELLNKIKNKLENKCSTFANINIINPYYEELKVVIRVVFNENIDKNIYKKILNRDISQFISPWLYDNKSTITISKNIPVINFITYLKSKKYIKYILNFYITKSVKDKIIYTYGFNDTITPSTNYSIFYPSTKHKIITEDTLENIKNDITIENCHIEEDLIINAEKNKTDTNNKKNNKDVDLITDTNDYYVTFK